VTRPSQRCARALAGPHTAKPIIMSDSILYQRTGRVATVTLNRPHAKNALDQAALDALTAQLAAARDDPEAWIVVIRAAGTDFCVGQDVKELVEKGNQGDYFEPVFRTLKSIYKPVVCAAQGLCLAGGAGIFMGADIRILAQGARMGWPHAKIGLCSIGGPSTLARMLPVNLALELMFTGEYLDAERASRFGLANHVVAEAALDAKLTEVLGKILANAPLAQRAMKQATLESAALSYEDALAAAHAILDRVILSHDAQEGMRAFVEKRKPAWQGR
jgi:enoyl-CoA hydratase